MLLTPSRYRDLISEVLTILHINQDDSKNIISLKDLSKTINQIGYNFSENYLTSILSVVPHLFHLFTYKSTVKKSPKERFIRPFFALNALTSFLYEEKQQYISYSTAIISDLFNKAESLDFNLSPHQLLPFPSDRKKRINSCLSFYSSIYILYNNITETRLIDLIHLIVKNENFTKHHRVFLLTNESLELASNLKKQFITAEIPVNIDKDYKERDIILFCRDLTQPFGAIIFPMRPLTPYYTITHYALHEILNCFLENMRI
jgi:hypothetical protein